VGSAGGGRLGRLETAGEGLGGRGGRGVVGRGVRNRLGKKKWNTLMRVVG